MKILLLEGAWEEIGEAFGKHLNHQARRSIEYMLSGSRRIASHAAPDSPLKRLLFSAGLELLFRLKAFRPADEREESFFKGFEKSSGYGFRKVLSYFYAPDASSYVMSLADRILKRSTPPVLLGCSSFVALPGTTKDGTTIHARNLDYIGGKYWEKGHCIAVLRPRGELASVNVISSGVFCPGITAVNEEGIGISLHMNFTRDVGFKNRPITSTVLEITSKARKLADAIEIARKNPPMGGWTIVVSSAKEGDAVAIEMSSSKTDIIHPDNSLIYYTNAYLSPAMRNAEYAPSYIWVENNHARLSRLKELLFRNLGNISPQVAAEILSDTLDPTIERETALGHTISNATNISSAIFNYEGDEIWVSDSPVPANRGSFKGYKISSLLSGKPEPIGEIRGKRLSEHKERAFRSFVEACFEWEESASPRKAYGHLLLAAETDPDEPLYLFNLALMLAKMGEYKQSLSVLKQLYEEADLNPTRRAQITLWYARLSDVCSLREKALELYREVIRMRAPIDLLKRAEKGLQKPFSPKELRKVDILPFIADIIE